MSALIAVIVPMLDWTETPCHSTLFEPESQSTSSFLKSPSRGSKKKTLIEEYFCVLQKNMCRGWKSGIQGVKILPQKWGSEHVESNATSVKNKHFFVVFW